MSEFEILAFVLLIESAPITREAEQEITRHFWRMVKEIRRLFKGGAP